MIKLKQTSQLGVVFSPKGYLIMTLRHFFLLLVSWVEGGGHAADLSR